MKLIFVTGGVISGLGKGVTASSIGRLMKSAGYSVNMIKIDPYLQVDAGTMSPYEHGEVFVTQDGMETDLDLGNYERFINQNLIGDNNPTTGKIYSTVIQKERKGDYLGKTVQAIPHVSDEIKGRILRLAKGYDLTIIEVGGMVGDAESPIFIESIRQLKKDIGRENVVYVHVVPLLYLEYSKEFKTKPIQTSVRDLRSAGVQPDILVCRSPKPMPKDIKPKVEMFTDVDQSNIFEAVNADTIYQVPLLLESQGFEESLSKLLNLPKKKKPDLKDWGKFVNRVLKPKKEVHIGIIGKYAEFPDAYMSLAEALIHAGAKHNARIHKHWIPSGEIEKKDSKILQNMRKKGHLDGIIVPGGFGGRGSEGKIKAIQYIRKNDIPFLGICLGLQMAVVEFARNVCGIKDACATEFKKKGTPVIDYLPDQDDTTEKGGTMRLGDYEAVLQKGSLVSKLYGGAKKATERHRHRYEVCPDKHEILESNGLVISGKSKDGRLAEYIEIADHKYFVATQAHPEFTSRPNHPNPLFDGLIAASLK